MFDKDNGTSGFLRNLSETSEDRTDFVCPVHVCIRSEVALQGIKNNQPCMLFLDCFLNSLVQKRENLIGFIDNKHAREIGFRFYQARFDGISPSPSSAV